MTQEAKETWLETVGPFMQGHAMFPHNILETDLSQVDEREPPKSTSSVQMELSNMPSAAYCLVLVKISGGYKVWIGLLLVALAGAFHTLCSVGAKRFGKL